MLLMAVLAFNFMDRLALGVVLQDIKVDLYLTDTQLWPFNGIAFALFYSVMGIPIARWADRGNRVTIIAITSALWSVMVALCGGARTFAQLFMIRVAVGVGEAGCIPPANSLIADYFTRAERPRATAVYMQGVNVSLIVAYFAAGWLNQFYGWRVMFVVLGLPGLVLAALVWFTIREPRCWNTLKDAATNSEAHAQSLSSNSSSGVRPSLKEVLISLWTNVTFRHLLYSFSVLYFFSYGIAQWQPAFFVRSFGLKTGELGTWFAVVYGLGGLVGTQLGGVLASRYAPHNEPLQLKAMAVANAIFNTVIWAFIYFSHSYRSAFAWMAFSTLGANTTIGPMYAITQTLVPARMRATALAIILLFANLIGMGLGPLAVGVLSDMLRPLLGQESLRYALLIFTPGYLWVWHLWHASRTVANDVKAATEDADDGIQGVGMPAVSANGYITS